MFPMYSVWIPRESVRALWLFHVAQRKREKTGVSGSECWDVMCREMGMDAGRLGKHVWRARVTAFQLRWIKVAALDAVEQ